VRRRSGVPDSRSTVRTWCDTLRDMGFFQRLFGKNGSSEGVDDIDRKSRHESANVAQDHAEMNETTRGGALGPQVSGGAPGFGNPPGPFPSRPTGDLNSAEEIRVAADQEDDNARAMLIEHERDAQERRDRPII